MPTATMHRAPVGAAGVIAAWVSSILPQDRGYQLFVCAWLLIRALGKEHIDLVRRLALRFWEDMNIRIHRHTRRTATIGNHRVPDY